MLVIYYEHSHPLHSYFSTNYTFTFTLEIFEDTHMREKVISLNTIFVLIMSSW